MGDSIIIYDVKTDDTLAKIGQKLGMSEDEVRDFHNINCEKNGLLYFNSLIGVEKIIIPKNFKSVAQINKEIAEAIPAKNISQDFYAENYKIIESYESDFENAVEISYTVNIRLEEKKENQLKILVASIKSSNFLNNGEKPDDKMSELSIACAESISPLQFEVYPEGNIAKMYQFENIQKVFQEKRKDIEDFHIGEVAQKYVDRFASNLSNQEYFEKQINSTFLYQILFPNLSWFHKQNTWKENFYLVKNSFPLNCNFNIEFHHINEEEIQTVLKGEVMEEVSLQQLLQGRRLNDEVEEVMTGLVELKYTTHKLTKQLEKIQAGIALIHEGELYRKHKITVSKI
ncbi:hypothetical protein [Frigoriflavimonas asaccharolytica]|uniref:LysM domain-containing protein n=1 Tax=Frigoriflavimonas asaccharolytica TaxID=2735899 RepID=A0A8J8GAX9_9FLAO|nr:hypothetical protein [Frigoriflavimonas asaccharolytica]NRS92302.1 hypothetical protein [Frigoriflavimonas asaccharolytica]